MRSPVPPKVAWLAAIVAGEHRAASSEALKSGLEQLIEGVPKANKPLEPYWAVEVLRAYIVSEYTLMFSLTS